MCDVSMIDGHIDELKMTDNDIKKALECCNLRHYHGCKGCAYFDDKKCIEHLAFDALDLINHQKAEIERLKYNPKAVLAERKECNCPDGCPGTLTTYEQIEMGIKK